MRDFMGSLGVIFFVFGIGLLISVSNPDYEYKAVCDSGWETAWTNYVSIHKGIVGYNDGEISKEYKQKPGETCWEERMLIETD